MKTGYFQTLEVQSPESIIIRDEFYGETIITEPVLRELLQAPALLRLGSVEQHGISGFLGITSPVTRLEHSIGAMLLVRRVGASLEEQVVGLLHDIAHTAFSHVVDWAFASDGDARQSFHEVHKMRYVYSTNLLEILNRHGYDERVFEEELFPLVEMPAPHLCADRLDYGLRDTVGCGTLSLENARRVLDSLTAYPDATSANRLLVLRSEEVALTLARAYMAADGEMWSNPAHVDMALRSGHLIGSMLRRGCVKEGDLWTLSDRELWETLRREAEPAEREIMRRLEEDGLPEEKGLRLPRGTKIRTVDPDVLPGGDGEPVSLSVLSTDWAQERDEYIRARIELQE